MLKKSSRSGVQIMLSHYKTSSCQNYFIDQQPMKMNHNFQRKGTYLTHIIVLFLLSEFQTFLLLYDRYCEIICEKEDNLNKKARSPGNIYVHLLMTQYVILDGTNPKTLSINKALKKDRLHRLIAAAI